MLKPVTFFHKIFPADNSYWNFIFIPLFFAFYFTLKLFEPATFLLTQFDGRSVSIATAEGIDIAARVALFYKGFALAAMSILVFARLTIIIRRYVQDEELRLANGISLAGFCLLFFQLLGSDLNDSIHFIFALLIVCLAGFCSSFAKKRIGKNFIPVFVWTITVSVSLYFLQWQISYFIAGKALLSLPKIVVLIGVPVYLFFTNRYELTNKVFKASQPLIFLPLLSFVAVEAFMIFNQHGIYITPKIIYFAGLIVLFSLMIYKFKKRDPEIQNTNYLQSLFESRIPWLLAGLACISYYQPIVKPEIDWFEDAHHVLPLHQLFSFGKIPFIDSFSGHGLSEFGFGLLYSFLNGADPMGDFIYHFMIKVFMILIVYFLIYKISGDGFLAIWIAVAYPYTELLIPSYFNFVPVAAFLLIRLYKKQSVSGFTIFFWWIIFILFWRIDLGSSTLLASISSLLFLIFFLPSFTLNKKNFFIGVGISTGVFLLLFLMAYIHSGSQLFESFKNILAYSSSFQSYGIKDLSLTHDIKYFSLYFIFPAAVLLLLMYFIKQVIRPEQKNGDRVPFILVMIFSAIFYFFNFQRGLVRHTLTEQWDAALTSYSFFIIAAFILYIFLNKNSYSRFLIFFIASTLLISNYVFTSPDLKQTNFFNSLTTRLNNPVSVPVSKNKISRVVSDPALESNYVAFSNWLKNNFPDTSTFLDFSNKPMLYFFTNRIVPGYFLQFPHTAHNDFLQNCAIDEFKKYDIPVVVFSSMPVEFWDNLDGIPNTIRHYRIAEYIYRNYSPAFILNNHSIWLRKNQHVNESMASFIPDTISYSPVNYTLKWIPFYWGAYDKTYLEGKIIPEQTIYSGVKSITANNEIKFPCSPVLNKDSGNYILIRALAKQGSETIVTCSFGNNEIKNGSFIFNLKNDILAHDYLIRISSQFAWYSKPNNWLSIVTMNNSIEITNVELLKGD